MTCKTSREDSFAGMFDDDGFVLTLMKGSDVQYPKNLPYWISGLDGSITAEDLVSPQCGVVIVLHPRNEEWLSGKEMTGV